MLPILLDTDDQDEINEVTTALDSSSIPYELSEDGELLIDDSHEESAVAILRNLDFDIEEDIMDIDDTIESILSGKSADEAIDELIVDTRPPKKKKIGKASTSINTTVPSDPYRENVAEKVSAHNQQWPMAYPYSHSSTHETYKTVEQEDSSDDDCCWFQYDPETHDPRFSNYALANTKKWPEGSHEAKPPKGDAYSIRKDKSLVGDP